MTKVAAGTWVEIKSVILEPGQRAPSLPEETQKVPYVMLLSGFLTSDAEIGDTVTIRTIIGREMTGTLNLVNPSYGHSFGKVVPELLKIGTEADNE